MQEENVAEKEMPAGGSAGTSKSVIGESGGSAFTKNSQDLQSANGPVGKLEWLKQVASDGSLPPSATRVAIAITAHVNGKSGVAWPSIDRLADILALVPNSVRKSIKALVQNGHLDVEVGGGNSSNRYRLIAKPSADPCTPVHPFETAPLHASAPHPCTPLQGTPAFPCTPPLHAREGELVDKNSEKELGEGTLSIDRGAEVIPIDRGQGRLKRTRIGQQLSIPVEIVKSTAEPRDFAAFWHEYPKKIGRLEAATSFREALKHADVEEIIAGARRYAESRQAAESDPVERERFTKSAERWLRGRHWRDEHAAPRPAGIGRHAAEAIAEAYGDEWGAL